MARVLAALDEGFGGVREYLLAAGASEADLAAARSRLRD
jgi:hypothetical protein